MVMRLTDFLHNLTFFFYQILFVKLFNNVQAVRLASQFVTEHNWTKLDTVIDFSAAEKTKTPCFEVGTFWVFSQYQFEVTYFVKKLF